MSWFRIDDTFPMHPKVRRAGNPAVGLWVRCGAYSSAYGTEGHIETRIARDFGSRREIAQLIDAGLWVPNGDGFVMHDFLDYNPTKDQDDARRAADRERQRRWREASAAARRAARGEGTT